MKLSLKVMTSGLSFFILLLLVLMLLACGDKQSPEEQVRQFIATGKAAAEERDVIGLSELISESYGDQSRRDRRAVVGLVTGYFLRHKRIHLFTQIDEIRFLTEQSANVKLYVAMAGTPVSGAQALIDVRADLYQFDLMLINENDEWRLLKANWQRANIEDLLAG